MSESISISFLTTPARALAAHDFLSGLCFPIAGEKDSAEPPPTIKLSIGGAGRHYVVTAFAMSPHEGRPDKIVVEAKVQPIQR